MIRHGFHVLDQDEFWQDQQARTWRMDLIPKDTARKILENLRSQAYQHMVRYTAQMESAAQAARTMGEDVDLSWQPDSAPFFDRCWLSEFEGGPMSERVALALQWLDTKPLIVALEERLKLG